MRERIQAISDALAIVNWARVSVYKTSPAAWDFLWRVTRYLSSQQRDAFEASFGSSDLLNLAAATTGEQTVEPGQEVRGNPAAIER
jgi:hypothetical protein